MALRVATSSYAGEIHDVLPGFDTARFLRSTLTEFLLGSGVVAIDTRIRNDNLSVVEHVHPANSVTKQRRPNGFAID